MLIGLTGGIACGKTTVSRMFTGRGATVIDADQIARDVVRPGSAGLEAIVAAFGVEVRRPDGTLDRPRLGALIFADPHARKRLEAITHPLIAAESMRRLGEALGANPPLVVYDAALLVESGRAEQFRPLVVVQTSRESQIARLMSRDGLDREAAERRLSSQMDLETKAAMADHVIDNSGTLAETEQQVARLWEALVSAP
jgi:dephospho-CoA kinase